MSVREWVARGIRYHDWDRLQHARHAASRFSLWELQDFYARATEIQRTAPYIRGEGSRASQIRTLAAEYGMSTKTVERYLARKLVILRCEGWIAAFGVARDGRPHQLTPWERA